MALQLLSIDELVAVVSRRVTLKQISREPKPRYVGLCPFHNEKTPSFQLWTGYRGEGRYHCKGCLKGGSSIDWEKIFGGQSAVGSVVIHQPSKADIDRHATEKEHARMCSIYHDFAPECVCPDWLLKFY